MRRSARIYINGKMDIYLIKTKNNSRNEKGKENKITDLQTNTALDEYAAFTGANSCCS